MEASTLEIIGEVLAFVILLITVFTLYGKAIRDYTSLKNKITELEKDYLELRKDIEAIKERNNNDYREILKKIKDLDVKNVEANAQQFEKLTKQIDSNFKIILDKLK